MATKTDLRVVLGVDGEQKFTATMKNLEKQQKAIRAETKNASAALGDNASAYEKNRVKAESLTKQIETQQKKVQTLKEAYEKAVEKKGEDSNVTLDLKAKYESAEAALHNMESSLAKTNKALIEHTEKADKATKALNDFGDRAEKVGDKMQSVGSKMTKYLTTSILGAGAAVSKAAIDYEDAFAGVRKTVDGSEEDFAKLNEQILDMSTNLPTSATEIAGVAEAAGQLGIAVEDIGNFTEVMTELGMSTNLSAEEAASSLAKFANVTKMSTDDYENLGSAIVDLGNNYATTEADIVEMATRLAATGEIVGYTQPQMLAIATALSSVGIEAEAGGSAFSKLSKQVALAVAQGGESLKKWADVAGVSADEFKQAYEKDALGALSMFIDGLNDTSRLGKSSIEILNDMGITEVRMSNAVLALSASGGILNDTLDTANAAWEDNSALQTEVSKRLETTGSKLTLAKNELTKTAIVMGDNFLPTIAELAGKVGEAAEKFGNLDRETQKSIAKFALVVAAAGPTVKIFGSLTSGVGKTTKAVSTLISTTKAIKAGTYTGPLSNVLSALTKTKNATGDLATSSSSLAGLLGASGPMVAAFAAAAVAALGLYAGYRKLTEGDRAVTEGVEAMLSGFGKWEETVSNATNLLAGLNSEIIVSSEKSSEISASVDAVQAEITQIATSASEARRSLTDKEIERIEELFEKLSELSASELELQQAYQDAAITMAQATTDYSKENAVDLIKTAQEAKDGTVTLAQQQYTERLLLLKQAYETEGTMSEEEYNRQVEAAQKEYDLAVQSANDKFASVNEIITQGYFEQNIQGNEHLQNLIDLNAQFEANEQQYADETKRIAEDMTLNGQQKMQQQMVAMYFYHKEKKSIQEQMGIEAENLSSEELEAWIQMSANTEVYGGKISEENKKIFNNFIGTYDNLPKKAKEKFRETMQGMIDGIKEKTGALYSKAQEIADGFIQKIEQKFDIHSPSRVMRKVFRNVVEGGVVGVDENKKNLISEAESTADSFLSQFEGMPEELQGKFKALQPRLQGLQAQLNGAKAYGKMLTAKVAQSITNNTNNAVHSTEKYDYSNHFDAVFKVENMTVRNDTDIRTLSAQIEAVTRNVLSGKGAK